MGLPFKNRRKSNRPPTTQGAPSNASLVERTERTPPFFRRRTSMPHPHQDMTTAAVVSPEHGPHGHTARCHSLETMFTEDDLMVDDDDDEEEVFVQSPQRPLFLSRSIVIRDEPPTLDHALRIWLSRTNALIKSPEMTNFLSSSGDLALITGGLVLRTACLPVTAPLHLASKATVAVVGTCGHAISTAGTIIQHVITIPPPGGEDTSSSSGLPLQGFFRHILRVTFQTVYQVKDSLGSTVIHLVAPVLGHNEEDENEVMESSHHKYSTSSGQSSAEQDSFLDRLRIDYPAPKQPLEAPKGAPKEEPEKMPQKITPIQVDLKSEVSKYLLHVGDLGLWNDEAPVTRVIMYIDLDKNFAENTLTERALDELVSRGLSLIDNVEAARLQKQFNAMPPGCIQWKPESSTDKLLKSLHMEWTTKLESNVLIWSGRMQGRWGRGHDFPFFLARGIVKRSPRQFLELFWDNSRTNEYNKHSLGRSDLLVIKDGVLSGASTGTKVVKSETRVPFTGISVVLATLMHVRPLQAPDEGFVIVSRSLNSGRAGCHIGSSAFVEKSNNEILWGVNILRRVPGKPHVTDLTSVSQVATSLVPKFLTHRIGIMGVEDFFSAVRC